MSGREDLSEQDVSDIEDLKSSLTNSDEKFHDAIVETRLSVRDWVKRFDTNVSASVTKSAPTSPSKYKNYLPPRTASVSDFGSIFPLAEIMTLEDDLKPLKSTRQGYKSWASRHLNTLKVAHDGASLTLSALARGEKEVNTYIEKIRSIEEQISEVYDKHRIDHNNKDRVADVDETVNFIFKCQSDISTYEDAIKCKVGGQAAAAAGVNSQPLSREELLVAVSKLQHNPSTVILDCQNFNGDYYDKHNFEQWLAQFNTVIKANPNWDDAGKLTFLKKRVGGNAKAVIRPVNIEDGGFLQAIEALKKRYSNKEFNKDQLFLKLTNARPAFCPEFTKTENFIGEMRATLLDLKNHYEADLLQVGTGGYAYISHLIFNKLPNDVQNAFINKLNKNYPTFDEIYDNHVEIISNLNRTRKKKESKDSSNSTGAKAKPQFTPSPEVKLTDNFASSAAQVKTNQVKTFHCRFCGVDGHASSYCKAYASLEARQKRCVEIGLCSLCTQSNHLTDSCFGKSNKLRFPCKNCNSQKHVLAMCDQKRVTRFENTNVCLSTNLQKQSNYLLPILAMRMQGHNGKVIKFNCLLDTASSRSYVSKAISDQLELNKDLCKSVDYQVKTFLGSGVKSLEETSINVFMPSGRYLVRSILVDNEFNVDLNVRGLKTAIDNIKKLNKVLASNYDEPVQGLIGADILQFIKELKIVPCMHGSAFSVATGIIPFGDTNHFLYPGQVPVEAKSCYSELNFKTVVSEFPEPESKHVNFCLNPKRSFEDPAAPFFPEASVERNIDNSTVAANLESMFNCESIGIIEGPDSISNYDTEKIKEFERGIEIINGQVHVELPFHDNVDDVPSNHNISLKICELVSNKLEAKGKLEDYNQLFFDQVNEDMIEEFECLPENFSKYNWIPHHPVYKDDATSTFPARPVFNCSLKSDKSKPSLNEASYKGINLMQDMAALIMKFRTNNYTLLGDLKKAFLQIKLKLLKDKNRFCFFLKVGDKLRCFRYKTIIFGYCTSPFILNYVLKYLANQSPQDGCTEMIRNNFFVDNLATTHNDISVLTELYKTCVDRMDKYHFDLRSCNSNDPSLVELMKKDGKYIAHGCDYDKVLGYRYSGAEDKMKLASVNIDINANTQRKLLSESPKIFDPIGLVTPVTVRSKTLLSSQWSSRAEKGPHWDKVISTEDSKTWSKLAPDLMGLSEVEFPRYTFSQDEPTDLLMYCDASKRAYGYAVYAKQNSNTNLMFSKCKSAPLKEKSLPTLELLGVYLGMQGLINILRDFKNVNFKNVYVAVDAQVVLSWILSDTIKTKKVFVANRIKDIKKMQKDILNEFNVSVQFKYVPTAENPADLLTRGLSLESFKQNLDFWLKGPTWIRSEEISWPSSELKCLSANSQNILMATQAEPASQVSAIFSFGRNPNFERFSLNKIVNISKLVIKFCNKIGALKNEKMREIWGSDDYGQCAKMCLLKTMQNECFQKEIDFLKDPRDKPIPELIRNFNLFLDENEMLRSDCRLGKVKYFDRNIIHPVFLPKLHSLTRLIVEDCHRKVRHLGVQSTLNKVRMSGFRLIKPFQTVKSTISPCAMCKRYNALSYKYPHMTNLPEHRVNLVRAFGHVGIDYTGHIMVREEVVEKKEENGKVFERKFFVEKKYYILIFTCLNVRACHIELIPEMSTEHFVLALVRFCNEYGIPSHIYSDNAKSFISGVHVLEKVLASNEFKDRFSIYNIKHIKIPLYSPWIGATWERLIRTVKSCLKKTIGRTKLEYFRLKTVLSDIQLSINCRPLTYRCADDNGLEVITPNKFLKSNVESNLILSDPKEILPKSVSRKNLIQSLNVREKMVSRFKELWYEQYLLSLRSLYKNLYQDNFENKIKVNDIVLIKNPAKGRQHWRLGRVIELIFGSDNKVRSAKILKGDEDWRTKERKLELHSISHLYPLELSITHNHVVEPDLGSELENLEVEDFSEIAEDTESNLGSFPNENTVGVDITEPQDEVMDDTSFRYTRELDPVEVENLNLIPDPLIETTQSVDCDSEPLIVPSISSRGRVRKPAKKPLDEEFINH